MMVHLIDNERRILSFLRERGTASKPEIAAPDGAGCGWATVTKLVDRLERAGFVEPAGTRPRSGRYGRSARVYALSSTRHCVLGIDVERETTAGVLLALDGRVLWQNECRTPGCGGVEALGRFLSDSLRRSLAALPKDIEIGGVGIGAPLPAAIGRAAPQAYARLADRIAATSGRSCAIENNVSAYAELVRQRDRLTDFVLVSIRTGVGGGLVLGNRLHRGMGYAGELGHVRTRGDRPCPCGRRGCLETEIGLPALARVYREAGGAADADPRDLFRRADRAAARAQAHLAERLAEALGDLYAVLHPPLFLVAGLFGSKAHALPAMIGRYHRALRGRVRYIDIGETDFMRASAQLYHRQFFT
ncbi:MAG: ROK family protein [Phycisphaerae bacterium]|nr:ROK family protein [Phycisphaerae bacterium]